MTDGSPFEDAHKVIWNRSRKTVPTLMTRRPDPKQPDTDLNFARN